MASPNIVHITACAVPGKEKTFVNVYGLEGSTGRVWQWNAKLAAWEPHKVKERTADAGGW